MALGKAPWLSLESGGAVSSNSHPCPRTSRTEEETKRVPSHLPSAFRLATRGAASGRRDGLVSRELCSLHHQPCGGGRQCAQDGEAAGGDGCVAGPTAQRPSHGGHRQLQSSDQQVVLPAPKEWEGFVTGRSSGPSSGLMVECRTLDIYRSCLLRHL